ncbi:MAG TPA: response regulator [Verrucomicrobiae bacterium]|jgi:CheY-like chemotaxis protein|nr:response regulator [Verrucomicrobiae bacterium]
MIVAAKWQRRLSAHFKSFWTAYAVLLASLALTVGGFSAGRPILIGLSIVQSAFLFLFACSREKSRVHADELAVQWRASESTLREVKQKLVDQKSAFQTARTEIATPSPAVPAPFPRELAHEFKNALAGVFGHVSLLRETSNLPVEVRDRVALMEQSALRARQLAFDLFPPSDGSPPRSSLPVAPPPVKSKREPAKVWPRGSGRVLVMDDEEPIRVLLGAILQHFGYEATTVADGTEAIREYKKALDTGKPYKAVIMDLAIPIGMGGREAIGELQNLDANVRAIISSGYSDDPAFVHFRKHGFTGRVAKPYRVEDVGKVLNEVLNASSRTGLEAAEAQLAAALS